MSREHWHLTVVADADALAKAPADRLSKRDNQASGRLPVCLTGGSTPERLYAGNGALLQRGALESCPLVLGDDRFVPQNNSRSNDGMARRLLLDRVPAPPGDIHAMPTSAGSAEKAARFIRSGLASLYGTERLDPRCPLFAMVLMGLGAYGHTASLLPGHAELDETERWVVGVDEAGLEPFVPRVTLTFPVLASTREMLFLVSGTGKREILKRVLSGADLPAARAYAEGDVVWLVDREAAPEHRYVA
jgi:6-phosphogluconolactonase